VPAAGVKGVRFVASQTSVSNSVLFGLDQGRQQASMYTNQVVVPKQPVGRSCRRQHCEGVGRLQSHIVSCTTASTLPMLCLPLVSVNVLPRRCAGMWVRKDTEAPNTGTFKFTVRHAASGNKCRIQISLKVVQPVQVPDGPHVATLLSETVRLVPDPGSPGGACLVYPQGMCWLSM
jgi:hypothetical protein